MNKWWSCLCVFCVSLTDIHLLSHMYTPTREGNGLYSFLSDSIQYLYFLFPLWELPDCVCVCMCARVCVCTQDRERGVPPLCSIRNIRPCQQSQRHKHIFSHIVWKGVLRELNNSQLFSFNDRGVRPLLGTKCIWALQVTALIRISDVLPLKRASQLNFQPKQELLAHVAAATLLMKNNINWGV